MRDDGREVNLLKEPSKILRRMLKVADLLQSDPGPAG